MTADGAESNPIYRGVWILERLLHDPPPPPPAVPALEAASADFGALTLKQKIELHRKQSACAACHAKIDPWGLALENFDAIGAWRDEEFTRALTWHMMTYALARVPNLGDESELQAIHRYFRTSGYKLSALVLAIVQSEVFQATPDVTVKDDTDTLIIEKSSQP